MIYPTVTFDRREFYRNLVDIERFLVELRYIDDGLQYLSEEQSSWWHGLPLIGPGEHFVDVEFGVTFPFRERLSVPAKFLRFFWQESKLTEVESHLQELAKRAAEWAPPEIENIRHRVEPFTWPRPSRVESHAIDPLVAAHDRLEDEVSADVGRLSHTLGNWEGPAADNFATYFYHPFEHTLRSQKQLLAALAGGLAFAQTIAEATQHSLMNVVSYVREELLEQLELRAIQAEVAAERARREAIRNVLIIAGGAATFLTGAASGKLWNLLMGTVAVSSAAARTVIPPGLSVEFELRGATAIDLLNALSDGVAEIDGNESEQHDELSSLVADALSRVEDLRRSSSDGDGRLIPIRPDIVDGVDGDDFHLPPT